LVILLLTIVAFAGIWLVAIGAFAGLVYLFRTLSLSATMQKAVFVLFGSLLLSPVLGRIYPLPLPLGWSLISFFSSPARFSSIELPFVSSLTALSIFITGLLAWALARWFATP